MSLACCVGHNSQSELATGQCLQFVGRLPIILRGSQFPRHTTQPAYQLHLSQGTAHLSQGAIFVERAEAFPSSAAKAGPDRIPVTTTVCCACQWSDQSNSPLRFCRPTARASCRRSVFPIHAERSCRQSELCPAVKSFLCRSRSGCPSNGCSLSSSQLITCQRSGRRRTLPRSSTWRRRKLRGGQGHQNNRHRPLPLPKESWRCWKWRAARHR